MTAPLLYPLDSKPKPIIALTVALQHVLASFVGIITPTLVIGAVLGLDEHVPYLMSMALLVSGLATFVQVKKIGPVGAGVIAVQGTSFAFLGALLAAGGVIKAQGGSAEDVLATLFGLCFVGAFVEIALSQVLPLLRRVITPVVTGVVIIAIGLSLIKVGMTDLAGGFGHEPFADPSYLLVGLLVIATVILCLTRQNQWLRISAILIAMAVGSCVGYGLGIFTLPETPAASLFSLPQPFKYGFQFDWTLLLPVAFIYLLTAIETTGDLTAVSHFSGLDISGKRYMQRIKGGVLGDGINSLLAALLNTFPNTTFGQNNAVVQMTGVASRLVGLYVAGLLILLGLSPVIGKVLMMIPKPVLGGATLVMFGTVAMAGIGILTREPMTNRTMIIAATALGASAGTMQVPAIVEALPQWLQVFFASPVTVAGLVAIVLSLLLPEVSPQASPQASPKTTEAAADA